MLRPFWNANAERREDRQQNKEDQEYPLGEDRICEHTYCQDRPLVRRAGKPGEEGRDVLKDLVQDHQQFIASMGSGMRDPLGSLIGIASAWSSADQSALAIDNEEIANQLQFVLHCARRMERLIDFLQRYVDVERLAVQSHVSRIDLKTLVRREIAAATTRADQAGVRLWGDPVGDPLEGTIDARKLQAILRMMIGLAVDVSEQGGAVRVDVRQLSDGEMYDAEIRVKDRAGVVMQGAPEVDPTDDPSGYDATRQMLIGFEVDRIQRLARALGGTLLIHTEPEFTTELALRLKLEQGAPLALRGMESPDDLPGNPFEAPAGSVLPDPFPGMGEDSLEEEEGAGNDREIILLVEDSADFRFYLRSCLEPDYQVIEAVHGKDGLAMAKEYVPDLIISDVMMPYMDGHTFCRRLKEDPALNHIPIVLSTALAAAEYQVQGLQAGADSYLVKPFRQLHPDGDHQEPARQPLPAAQALLPEGAH